MTAAFVVSNAGYLLSGLLLPDVGDEAPIYMFFGLITDPPVSLCQTLAIVLFVLSLVAMFYQIIATPIFIIKQNRI